MSSFPLDLAARAALGQFPAGSGAILTPLGNAGGFSGARLWRAQGDGGDFCLKVWPAREADPQRLAWIHGLMRRAREAGLAFVPAVEPTADGVTWVERASLLWDLTNWMPGRADFHVRPTTGRMRAACTALALLHNAWEKVAPRVGTIPGIARRRERAAAWRRLLASGWRPDLSGGAGDPVRPWAERAWQLLPGRIERAMDQLARYDERLSLPLQPCLCDVWHDHVLFDGATVTGLLDYGSVKVDHVAVDLARLLGSLAGDDPVLRAAGLWAYTAVRLQANAWEDQLVELLDRTGTLLAAANWLVWLYRDGRVFEDREAVVQRLAALVRRIEGWQVP